MLFITQQEDINIDLQLQVLYFYANWAPLHKKFLSMIEKIENTYKTSCFAIDSDDFSNQCKRFSITSIPTILVLSHGNKLKKINGFISTYELISIFDDIYKCNGEKHDISSD